MVTKSRFRQIRREIFENDHRRQVPFNLKSWVHFVVKPQFCFYILFFSYSKEPASLWELIVLPVVSQSPVLGSNELLSPPL